MSDASASTTTAPPPARAVDPALLEMLRCPLTLSRLRLEGEELVAEVGGLRYPVREGIPQMLPEEARLPDGVASLDALKAQLKEQGQLRP